MSEVEFRELPDELDSSPPGPALASMLSTLDPADYNGWQLVILLAARQRQVSYEQAQLLRVARELAFSPHGGPMRPPARDLTQDPYVGTEIGFALALTEYSASELATVAVFCCDRVPAVGQALAEGRIDLPKARLLCAELADATDPQARAIVEALLTEAARSTTTILRARLRRLLSTVDPDALRQRHAKAVENRWVHHQEHANGTSSVMGGYLPADRAAAAFGHLDAIAAATKAAGDPRRLDQIRADVFTDLLAGVDPARAGAATPAPRKGVIDLQIGLTTLACLDHFPGEIAGFGPVLADLARQAAAQQATTAQWRYTITDPTDHSPVAHGLLDPATVRAAGLRDPSTWPARSPGSAHPRSAAGSASSADPEDPAAPGYSPTAPQKAFVQARDRTCRAPGCTRPAQRCDIDHIVDWAQSHTTTITNLCVLCRRHHRAKHVGRYQVRRGFHGIDWTTPRGHRYTVIAEQAPAPGDVELDLVAHVCGHDTPHLRR
jgi:hypothetical protein